MTEKEKKEKLFAEWSQKGTDWIMNKLWSERKNNNKDFYRYCHEINPIVVDEMIANVNANMSKVLMDEGVRPKKLIVTYKTENCELCGYFNGEYCELGDDYEELCETKEVTRTFSFYSFEIDNGYMKAITNRFENTILQVLKVTDYVTNEVLYEFNKEETT